MRLTYRRRGGRLSAKRIYKSKQGGERKTWAAVRVEPPCSVLRKWLLFSRSDICFRFSSIVRDPDAKVVDVGSS